MIVTILEDGGITMEHSVHDCVVHVYDQRPGLDLVLQRKEELIQKDIGTPGIAIDVVVKDGHESIRTL